MVQANQPTYSIPGLGLGCEWATGYQKDAEAKLPQMFSFHYVSSFLLYLKNKSEKGVNSKDCCEIGFQWISQTALSLQCYAICEPSLLFLFFPQSKSKFSTYVVASGVQYGAEERILHYFFKVGTCQGNLNDR